MTDIWTPEKRSEVMSKVRGKGNKSTELVLARMLRAGGITGWRRHLPLPGKPDFCFPGKKLVIFVDGCFWHGCPKCYRRPKSRQEFWDAKVLTNKTRDRRVNRELKALGYVVMRIFEHRLKKGAPVVSAIRMRLGLPGKS
jgi:DNA mismatch endonuclease (patch repair protein)